MGHKWPGTCLSECIRRKSLESVARLGGNRSRTQRASLAQKSENQANRFHGTCHIPCKQETGRSEGLGELGRESQATLLLPSGQTAASPPLSQDPLELYSQSRMIVSARGMPASRGQSGQSGSQATLPQRSRGGQVLLSSNKRSMLGERGALS